MINKKAEINPIVLMVSIVVIGLVLFFGFKALTSDEEVVPEYNVTKVNYSVTSTATQYVNKAGGINVTNGQDLTLKNPVMNVTVDPNNKSQVLVKVIYPNRTMTPGDIMSTNLTEICVSGYSDSVRDVSDSLRDQVYIEYRLSPNQPTGSFEIDHLVPLSIGGSNDIKNLWPQPAEPRPGYKEKDVLETYYHKQVCAGKMDLREAQSIMANNWFQGYVDAKMAGGIK